MRDSSGIEFIYENAPRQFDAGILLMGHEVNQLMIIPPQATNYGVTGVCSSECTSRVSMCMAECLGPRMFYIQYLSVD